MNIETTCNTPDDVLFEHIEINSQRDIQWLKSLDAHDGHAVIVGGGPSVIDWIEEIRARKEHGQVIFALNGAAKYLKEQGIEADYCVVVDARDINTVFMGYAREHLLSSQCHPGMFEQDSRITLWHQEYPDDMERLDACLPADAPAHTLIGGGTTVGLSAMVIAYALGYRSLHLYGYDSSFRDDQCHAYAQTDPQRIECTSTVAGRSFKTTLAMARQAELFPQLSDSLIDLGCTITIRGDGLLPWTSQMSAQQPVGMTEQEKYKTMWSFDSYRNVAPGEQVASFFCLAANPKPSDTVIDFGAGTGRGAKRIQGMRMCNVVMLDFADNCLDEEVKNSLGDKLSFQVQDLTKEILIHAPYGYCTDVLEHIPPEDVDKVLDNIFKAADAVFFQISTVPDHMGALIGQPLHLTVQPHEWWYAKLSRYGDVSWSEDLGNAALFYVKPSTT